MAESKVTLEQISEGIVPDDCIPECAVVVVQFMDPEGESRFGVAHVGRLTTASLLGLLRLAEHLVVKTEGV